MRDNFLSIQGRLAEIERVRRNEDQGYNDGLFSLQGENSQQDWEVSDVLVVVVHTIIFLL